MAIAATAPTNAKPTIRLVSLTCSDNWWVVLALKSSICARISGPYSLGLLLEGAIPIATSAAAAHDQPDYNSNGKRAGEGAERVFTRDILEFGGESFELLCRRGGHFSAGTSQAPGGRGRLRCNCPADIARSLCCLS